MGLKFAMHLDIVNERGSVAQMKCPRCQFDNPDGTRFCGYCGRDLEGTPPSSFPVTMTYQTPTKGLVRGTTFARRFEIIEEIGQGGMGAVYKAYDTKIREVVALKLLKPEIASDPEIIERFRNEMKLARKVAHRHVCRMYDLSEEGLSFYISMEYVPGEDLKSFIRRSGHLNEGKALNLARQIAEGLAEAHRLGVVHRDLKPQNVMIDREGNAKIMDFGIARSLHSRGLTSTGVIIGTPEYMSPEQADARDVDRRSDVYSFGVILYEMVTGRVPFEGETPLSIVLKHKSEPAPDPKASNAQISQGFSQLILRCLEKDRGRRYQRAEDILEDLDRIGQGLAVTRQATAARKPITSREITVKFNLRKLAVPGLAAVLLIVAALAVLKPWAARKAPAQKSRGVIIDSLRRDDIRPPGFPPIKDQPQSSPETSAAPGSQSGLDFSKVVTLLTPIIGGDSAGLLKGQSAEDVDKFLTSLKEKVPAFAGKIGDIQTQMREGRRWRDAGNSEASRKSYTKGESETRKLLTLVNEKQKADQAKSEMDLAKKKAEDAGRRTGPNLLSWIASEKEKDAHDSYQKNDFASARLLYGILNRVYLLSLRGGDEDQSLAALRNLVATARKEADAGGAPDKEAWLYGRAQEEQAGAAELARDKAYPEAAERLILAAFLYEKATEVARESAMTGQK
jgi:serine/threonine protein kinase